MKKFKVGDKVWRISTDGPIERCNHCLGKIYSRAQRYIVDGPVEITYLAPDPPYYMSDRDDVFYIQAEAQTECDKRNKENEA